MSKPRFYDPGGDGGIPKGPDTTRLSRSLPCPQGAGCEWDWHRPEPEALGEGGCPRPESAGSQGQSPTAPPPPPASCPWGRVRQRATHGIGPQMCFVWPTAVFVKNVTELPTFKNRVISYPNLHISACWKTSLGSQEIWQYWARVPTQDPLLAARGGEAAAPFTRDTGRVLPWSPEGWGSEAWAPNQGGSLAAGLCHLLVV